MPITHIRLRNFRCFADSREVPVKPLTIIFGRNNSGKSSIFHSLSLLRQTMDSPEYGERLNMRGPLYSAGTYPDLVHQHRATENILMEFGVKSNTARTAGKLELEFSSDEPQPPRLARLLVEPDGLPKVEIRRGRGRGGPYELWIADTQIGGERRANFRFPVNRFLPLIGSELPGRGRPNRKRETARTAARGLLQDFESSLRDLRAVGPFRTAPDRRYEYQGRPPQLVDLRGQNVVHALIEDATRRGKHRGELLLAVNRWLQRVARVRLLPLKRISASSRLYEIRMRDTDSGRWANFADVGFGVGQAFPVLVEGLRTPPGGTFIVQEPEIHLHPDAQLAIADFLVMLAQTGRTVLVETHSEAVLLRVRHAMLTMPAERGKHFRPSDVSVIYVGKQSSGASATQVLHVDSLARIENWPKGFMDELTTERLNLLETMAAHEG